MIRQNIVDKGAQLLTEAWRNNSTTGLLTERWPDLDMPEAEAIALRTVELKGNPVVGLKLGFTSAAMRSQMNIPSANYGWLTADMDFSDRGASHGLVHPRVEPEIAIKLKRDLGGEDITSGQARDAIESLHPALEIVDTRFHEYRFTLVDNTADNSSAAGFVLGRPYRPADVLDGTVSVELEAAGKVLGRGVSSDAMGGPLQALLWLAREFAKRSMSIPEGSIVLTGGLTPAPVLEEAVEYCASFSGMGKVGFSWTRAPS